MVSKDKFIRCFIYNSNNLFIWDIFKMKTDINGNCEHVHKDAPAGSVCEDCSPCGHPKRYLTNDGFCIYPLNPLGKCNFKQLKGGKKDDKEM